MAHGRAIGALLAGLLRRGLAGSVLRKVLHVLCEEIRASGQGNGAVHEGPLLGHLEDRVVEIGYVLVLDAANLLALDLLVPLLELRVASALLGEAEPPAA